MRSLAMVWAATVTPVEARAINVLEELGAVVLAPIAPPLMVTGVIMVPLLLMPLSAADESPSSTRVDRR